MHGFDCSLLFCYFSYLNAVDSLIGLQENNLTELIVNKSIYPDYNHYSNDWPSSVIKQGSPQTNKKTIWYIN